MNNQKILKIRLFGRLSIEFNGKQLVTLKNRATKVMQLLQILFYKYPSGIGRSDLLEYLYGKGDVLTDPSNNLRVLLHRLRKMLANLGLPGEECILNDGKEVCWNKDIPLWVDVTEFNNLLSSADDKESNGSLDEAIRCREAACDLYEGDFLSVIGGEDWVIVEAIYYKSLYENNLEKLCIHLKEKFKYIELLPYVIKACEIYPLDEWQIWKIECLLKMGKTSEALKVYENTSKLYFNELGIPPSEKMINQFQKMSRMMDYEPQEITDFKKEISEKSLDSGPYYCTLPSFIDGYRMIRRMLERNCQTIILMLCSLTDGYGNSLDNKNKMELMSDELGNAIKRSLRRVDVYTKCSPSQYMVLLPGADEENCDVIIHRISKKFCEVHKYWKKCIKFYTSSVMDPEELEKGISSYSRGKSDS